MNATITECVRPARPAPDPVDEPIVVEVLAGRLGAHSGAPAERDATTAEASYCIFTGYCWAGWDGPC